MIELLVAITIFAIVIPSLSAGIRGLVVLNNRARDLALISLTAENKSEQLRSAGFNSLTNGTYDFSSELPNEISRPKSASYTISTPSAGLREVVINISFWDYKHSRTQTYRTLVGELGVGQ